MKKTNVYIQQISIWVSMTGVQVINTTHQMHILKGKAIIIKGASFNNRGLYISTCSRNPIRRKYLY